MLIIWFLAIVLFLALFSRTVFNGLAKLFGSMLKGIITLFGQLIVFSVESLVLIISAIFSKKNYDSIKGIMKKNKTKAPKKELNKSEKILNSSKGNSEKVVNGKSSFTSEVRFATPEEGKWMRAIQRKDGAYTVYLEGGKDVEFYISDTKKIKTALNQAWSFFTAKA